MSPRLKRSVLSLFRTGYEHPAGTEVKLIEPLGADRRSWIVEIRVPDGGLEGGAWYDHAELLITDLDFMPELEQDIRTVGEMELCLKERHFEDVALAIGSCELPRKDV